jgi:hypothetical protein
MRPWTAEDVEKWGAGYIANQMNGFVQNIEKLRAEVERLKFEVQLAIRILHNLDMVETEEVVTSLRTALAGKEGE